jgi:hypothetical protein
VLGPLPQAKLDQVADLGCSCFAILFDDIVDHLQPKDKAAYPSLAHAHAR